MVMKKNWFLDCRKQESEIWVSSNDYSIFVGDGYTPKEKKRSKELAKVITKALNDYEGND
tara:strand:+ start:413 stop:592 length:180 start_codon:yes stop_codon:yes gene_type:complete